MSRLVDQLGVPASRDEALRGVARMLGEQVDRLNALAFRTAPLAGEGGEDRAWLLALYRRAYGRLRDLFTQTVPGDDMDAFMAWDKLDCEIRKQEERE